MPSKHEIRSIAKPLDKSGAERMGPQFTVQVTGDPRECRSPGIATAVRKSEFLNFRVARALAMIESDYAVPGINLDLVSRRLGVTKAYFCRVFRQEVGMGLPEYVRRVRIQEAEKLLRETILSIKEIAAAVGFGYVTQLDRAFRTGYGSVPSEYRRQVGAGKLPK